MDSYNSIPKIIEISVQGPCPEGLVVRLEFPTNYKNNFYYSVFLNKEGFARVTREELLDSFDTDRELALMDYGDPRRVIDGEIKAIIKNVEQLRSALKAYYNFERIVLFEDNYEEKLAAAIRRAPDPRKYTLSIAMQK